MQPVTVARVTDDSTPPPPDDGTSQPSGGEVRPLLAEPHAPEPAPELPSPSSVVPGVPTGLSAPVGTAPTPGPTVQRVPPAELGTHPTTSVVETTGPLSSTLALPAAGEPPLADPPVGDVTRPTLGSTPATDQPLGADVATAGAPFRGDAAAADPPTTQRLTIDASPDAPAVRQGVQRPGAPSTPLEPRSGPTQAPVEGSVAVAGAHGTPPQPEVQRLLQIPTTRVPGSWVPTRGPAADGTPDPPANRAEPSTPGQPQPVVMQAPIVQRQPHRQPPRSLLPARHESPSGMRAVPLQRMFDDHAPPAGGDTTPTPARTDFLTPPAGTWQTAAESTNEGPSTTQVMTWTPAVQRDVATQAPEPTSPEGQVPDTTPSATVGADESASTPGGTGAQQAAIGDDPAALEELARRLYDPLSALLRAELWLDRERAGLVTERRR